MLGYIVRRIISSAVVILVASVIVFGLVASLSDPLGDLKARNPPVPAQVIEIRRQQLNLDKPIPQRYAIWLTDFARGDFGEDNKGREVRPILIRRLLITLRMVVAAAVVALVLAVAVGVFSAVRQYSLGDYTFTFLGFLFLSTPVFWLAALLKEFGAIRINRFFGAQVVYTVGAQSPTLPADLAGRLANYAGHMVLPVLALALISFAAWSRYQRASMLDVMQSDYIRLARAKGISSFRVLTRHAMRTALIPLTTVVAIDFAVIIGGAVITEQVFAWNGMGSLLIQGIRDNDPNLVLAWLMVTGVVVVTLNLLADILYGVLDPRIRYG